MAGKVVVFGSFVVDLTGRADHLPTQTETVFGSSFRMGSGGKGSNQAVAAHRAGADVQLVTKLGNDVFANVALDFYKSEGMDADLVFLDPQQQTGTALIMVDENSGQNQILVTPGACLHISDDDIEKAREKIESAQIVLLQFEVNLDANRKVIDIAKKAGATVVLNPAPIRQMPDADFAKVDIITPNEFEASALSRIEVANMDDAAKACDIFQSKGVNEIVITMGEQGAYVRSGRRDTVIARHDVDVVDTTGAGDAFSGGLVTALAQGKDLFEAAQFANTVAALCVTKPGTAMSMPTRQEIDAFRR